MIQYHSPERFRNGQLSPLDDAWGLAGTLFSMLTTARPFGELRPEIEARIYQGVPPLGAYGINDDQLYAIVAAAMAPDPTRRTQSVTTFRLHLEHWANDPQIRALAALEDEEGGEDDQAATAMLEMESMVFEEPSTSRPASMSDANMFAPPSFDPRSSEGAPRPPPRPSRPQAPEPVQQSPLGEQDATVMRELPAHIIAMAARAASGSSPPPPRDPAATVQYQQPQAGFAPPPAEDEPDYGQATKIAPAPDMASVLAQSRGPAQHAPVTPPLAAPPGAPNSPRQVPRAFKQTQLGMGGVGAPAGVPRPGFNSPYPYQQPPQEPVAEPAPEAADDDDGGRTVMRESPVMAPEMFQRAAQAQWKPAPPPVQPQAFGGVAQTDRPPHQSPGGQQEAGGVSALIQDTLQNMGPGPAGPMGQGPHGQGAMAQGPLGPMGGSPMQPGSHGGQNQGGPPPGFPQGGGFEPSGGGFPGPFQPTSGGPFQPVGMQGGYPGQALFELGPGYGGGQMMDAPSMDAPPMGFDQVDQGVGGYPRAPGPQAPARRGGSRAGLFVVCLLVLVLAAALTFLALKFRPQLGF